MVAWLQIYGTITSVGYLMHVTEMHTAEPLVPKPSSFEAESPGIDHISAEFIKHEAMHYVLRFTTLLILF